MIAHWDRISVVRAAEKFLLIDRENGRWVMLEPEGLPALRTIRDMSGQPDELAGPARDLLDQMVHAGVGGAVTEPSDVLNTLILKVTKVCNYGCKYCYDMEPEDRPTHISLDTATAAVDEALRLASKREGVLPKPDLTVLLHGGEPTIVFNLIKQIVLAGEASAIRHGKRIRFYGQTNLSRINAEMVEFFQTHSISWGISLDGPPELNDANRVSAGGKGTYHYFEKALREFPDFVRRCGVLTTVTQTTHDALLPIARHFKALGIQAWDWSLFQPIGMGRAEAIKYAFNVDTLIASWNELFAAVESGEMDGFYVNPVMDYLENFILGPGGNMCMRRHCGAARDLLSVSHDGTIEACDCVDRRGPLANLGTVTFHRPNSLELARSSERAQAIRSRDVSLGQCRTCAWLAVCGGTCMAHAGSVNGLWLDQCAIAMNAFARIADSLAKSNALRRYWDSVLPDLKTEDELAAAGIPH